MFIARLLPRRCRLSALHEFLPAPAGGRSRGQVIFSAQLVNNKLIGQPFKGVYRFTGGARDQDQLGDGGPDLANQRRQWVSVAGSVPRLCHTNFRPISPGTPIWQWFGQMLGV